MNRTACLIATGALVAGLAAPVASAAPSAGAVDPTAAVPPAGSQAYGWTAAFRRAGTTDRLVLINPAGTVRTLGTPGSESLLDDVSQDARHVITSEWVGRYPGEPRQRVTLWDTAARTSVAKILPVGSDDGISAAFNGFLMRHAGSGVVQLRGWDGNVLRTYPTIEGAGRSPVAMPSGRHFMEQVGDGVVVRDMVTGKVTNQVAAPAGTTNCLPEGGWDTQSGSMVCETATGAWNERVYRVGLTSAVKTTPLSPLGWGEARPTEPRVISTSSSFGPTATWVPGQAPTTFAGSDTTLTGAVGTKVYLRTWDVDLGGGPLEVHDLTTGERTPLAPGSYRWVQTVDKVG